MSFAVYSPALRGFAHQLDDAHQAAEAAKHYVDRHGTFSMHESGLMGMMVGSHRHLVSTLEDLFTRLSALTDASSHAMNATAAHYEQTDLRTASDVDATYPSVPRPSVSRD